MPLLPSNEQDIIRHLDFLMAKGLSGKSRLHVMAMHEDDETYRASALAFAAEVRIALDDIITKVYQNPPPGLDLNSYMARAGNFMENLQEGSKLWSLFDKWTADKGGEEYAVPQGLSSDIELIKFLNNGIKNALSNDGEQAKFDVGFDPNAHDTDSTERPRGIITQSPIQYDFEDIYNAKIDMARSLGDVRRAELEAELSEMAEDKDLFMGTVDIADLMMDKEMAGEDKVLENLRDKSKERFEKLTGDMSIDLKHLIPDDIEGGEIKYKGLNEAAYGAILNEVENKLRILSRYFPKIVSGFQQYTKDRCLPCNERIQDSFETINAITDKTKTLHKDTKHPATAQANNMWTFLHTKLGNDLWETQHKREQYDKDPSSSSWKPVCHARVPVFGLVTDSVATRPYNISQFKTMLYHVLSRMLDSDLLEPSAQEKVIELSKIGDSEVEGLYYAFMKKMNRGNDKPLSLAITEDKGTDSQDLPALVDYIDTYIHSESKLPQEPSSLGAGKSTDPSRPGSGALRVKYNPGATARRHADEMLESYRYYRTRYASANDFEQIFMSPEDVEISYMKHVNADPENGAVAFVSKLGYYYSNDHPECQSRLNEDDKVSADKETTPMKVAITIYLAAIDPILSMMKVPGREGKKPDQDGVYQGTIDIVRGLIDTYFGKEYSTFITPEFVASVQNLKRGSNAFSLDKIAQELVRVRGEASDIVLSGQTSYKTTDDDSSLLYIVFRTKEKIEKIISKGLEDDGLIDTNNGITKWNVGVDSELDLSGMERANVPGKTSLMGHSSSAYEVIFALQKLQDASVIDIVMNRERFAIVRRALTAPKLRAYHAVRRAREAVAQMNPTMGRLEENVRVISDELESYKAAADPTKDHTLIYKQFKDRLAFARAERDLYAEKFAEPTRTDMSKEEHELAKAVRLFNATKDQLDSIQNALKDIVSFVKTNQNELLKEKKLQIEDHIAKDEEAEGLSPKDVGGQEQ